LHKNRAFAPFQCGTFADYCRKSGTARCQEQKIGAFPQEMRQSRPQEHALGEADDEMFTYPSEAGVEG
jgi:hypothetical protein